MKPDAPWTFLMRGLRAMAIAGIAVALLPGCSGFLLPPFTVELDLAEDVQIPGIIAATGSADIPLGAFCGLFNEEELDAMVRASAGDLIADLVTITRVELASTEIIATEGNFDPFETAALSLTILELGGETFPLGAATNAGGLGTIFSLTQAMPVDLLNDLEEDQCGSPMLHLEGGGLLEAGDITFDVGVTVRVHAQFGG